MNRQRKKNSHNTKFYCLSDVIDPYLVVEPFLAILRAPYLAGPFKLVALDALQTFTSCNLFSEIRISGGETLAKVVDAVTRFGQFTILSESHNFMRNECIFQRCAWSILMISNFSRMSQMQICSNWCLGWWACAASNYAYSEQHLEKSCELLSYRCHCVGYY